MADIRQLKKMFSDIFRIDILGGEPLLNPQLKEYVVELRSRASEYIYSNIYKWITDSETGKGCTAGDPRL